MPDKFGEQFASKNWSALLPLLWNRACELVEAQPDQHQAFQVNHKAKEQLFGSSS